MVTVIAVAVGLTRRAPPVTLAQRTTPPPPQAARSEALVQALTRATIAALQSPEDPHLALEAGRLAGDLGRYEASLEWFTQAEQLDTGLIPAITGQGQMWSAMGRPGKAVQAYERALRQLPDEPRLLMALARAYTDLRDFGAALKHGHEAEQLGADDPAAQRLLVDIHLEVLEGEKAVQHAERACELAPDDAESWQTKGYALLQGRRYGEAETALRRALELDPGHPLANIYLAQALIEGASSSPGGAAGSDASRSTEAADREAYAVVSRTLTVDPYHAAALLLHGQILVRAKEYPLAIAALRRARESSPRDPDILRALGQALIRAKKPEEGARLVRKSQQLAESGVSFSGLEAQAYNNPDASLDLRLAELYMRNSRYDSALHVLARAQQRAPNNPEVRDRLAVVRKQVAAVAPGGL